MGENETALSFYEFFAGVGMARLGLEPHWNCAWANDNDPVKNRIYRHKWGDAHLDVRDVAEVEADLGGAPSSDGPSFPQGLHMAWASFPCQDLSLAGWRRGMSAGRSGAWWPFWRLMYRLERRPPIIVVENVAGLLYGDNFTGLCESLAALGMRFGAMLLDAKHFLPQSRPRVFVVAVDAALDTRAYEDPEPGQAPWYPKAVREAHEALPPDLAGRWIWWRMSKPEPFSGNIRELVEDQPSGVTFHEQAETQRLLAMMTPRNREKVTRAQALGSLQVGFLYKRMRSGVQRAEVRFDGIAGCLRTPKGGSSRQTLLLVEGDRIRSRLLSPLEAARLMGVPLNQKGCLPEETQPFFPRDCRYNQAYMAMGDGVAVPVVRHLSREILTPLARKWKEEDRTHNAVDYAKRVDHRIQSWEAEVS